VKPRSRSYHSAISGPALADSRDEYCIIKYSMYKFRKNMKEKNIFKKLTAKSNKW
jgi:hypothetical protein